MAKLTTTRPLPPAECTVCGKIAELRPYGKNGAAICFTCGTSTAQAMTQTIERFLLRLEQGGRTEDKIVEN
jgi:hypothetical protein